MNNNYTAVWEHESHTIIETVIWKLQDIRDNWIGYIPVVTFVTIFILAGLLG